MRRKITAKDLRQSPAMLERVVKKMKKRRKFFHRLRRVLLAMLALAVFASAVLLSRMPLVRVTDEAMAPMLKKGDVLLLSPQSSYARGAVVAVEGGRGVMLRRVIAFGGEQLDVLSDGSVLIDGALLDEEYASLSRDVMKAFSLPLHVGEDEFFLLSDVHDVTDDPPALTAPAGKITGKAVFRLWPFRHSGFISY